MVMARTARWTMAACLAGLLWGCAPTPATTQDRTCPAGQGMPMTAYELFFGRSIDGGGEVSDEAWRDFLMRVITPNLPNGYTVFDGFGHWRDPGTGHSEQERSKMLLAAVVDTPESAAAIARIREAYAARFHQSSVGLAVTPICGAF
jgi:Protein of unknown function (DUF3574)